MTSKLTPRTASKYPKRLRRSRASIAAETPPAGGAGGGPAASSSWLALFTFSPFSEPAVPGPAGTASALPAAESHDRVGQTVQHPGKLLTLVLRPAGQHLGDDRPLGLADPADKLLSVGGQRQESRPPVLLDDRPLHQPRHLQMVDLPAGRGQVEPQALGQVREPGGTSLFQPEQDAVARPVKGHARGRHEALPHPREVAPPDDGGEAALDLGELRGRGDLILFNPAADSGTGHDSSVR